MTLEEARLWAKKLLAEGHLSDGCTHARDRNFKECCQMHDLLRYVAPVKRHEADRLLRLCIANHGHPVLAWVYWLAVVVARKLGFYT